MKRFLLVLLLAAPCFAQGDNLLSIRTKLEQLPSEIDETTRRHAKVSAQESEIQSRLRNLPEGSPDAERLKAELNEVREILEILVRKEQCDRDRLRQLRRELQTCPERKLINAMDRDKRLPSKADLSGVWRSLPYIPAYVVQLEQHGKSVGGRGLQGGCLGNEIFEVNGFYEGDKLSLTFSRPNGNFIRVFRYYEERRQPRFKLINSKVYHAASEFDEWIMPADRKAKSQ